MDTKSELGKKLTKLFPQVTHFYSGTDRACAPLENAILSGLFIERQVSIFPLSETVRFRVLYCGLQRRIDFIFAYIGCVVYGVLCNLGEYHVEDAYLNR